MLQYYFKTHLKQKTLIVQTANLPHVEWEQERREAQYISLHALIPTLR